jgi:phosphoglycolate phosphatase
MTGFINNLQALLFDFDGTLAPNLDLPDMRRQVIALTESQGVPAAVYRDRYIVEVIEAAADWMQAQGRSDAQTYRDAAHALITQIEIDAAAATAPFEGIDRLLQELRNSGFKLGVVTRNCRTAVLQVYPDLLRHVDHLVARDDAHYLKPDVRHLSQCLAALDCAPGRAAMIGDGVLDMHAGAALKMQCIGVLTGSSDRARLTEAGAQVVLDHCLDLLTLT